MDPVKIYADAVGHSHEAACAAVFSAGIAEGKEQLIADAGIAERVMIAAVISNAVKGDEAAREFNPEVPPHAKKHKAKHE